jgi:hypothetical protein
MPDMPGGVRRVVLSLVVACAALSAAAQEIRTVVVVPDGTRLATDVYLPAVAGFGPWPVVLQRTPYGKDGLLEVCRLFNLWGYVCVAQDVRGTGASTGTDTVFRDDGPDGRFTLDWVTTQWWSNDRVATFGASALGITEYALAPGASAALKCQIPVVATPDFYHHAAYQGGALREALVYNWLSGQDNLAFYQQIRQHRLYDAWWQEVAILPAAPTVNAPGLHVGGWYDIFLQGTLDAFTTFQHAGGPGAVGRQKLVIGPWTHTGTAQLEQGELTYPPNAGLDVFTLFRDWLDHWLKGTKPAVASWPAARVYVMGAVGESGAPGNTWVDLDDWPPATGTELLYLTPAGSLVDSPAIGGSMTLTSNPADPVPTLGGNELFADLVVNGRPMGAGPYDQREIEARADVVEFTSSYLLEPVTVMGRVEVHLWVRPDTPDLDLAVRLVDVYPDGRAMLVTDSIQRARKRCGDDRECFLQLNQPTEIVVELQATAIAFNAMHRIRIDVSGSNAPRFEVNPNDGGDLNQPTAGVVAHPVLLFGSTRPSRVELPVVGAPRTPRRHLGHR